MPRIGEFYWLSPDYPKFKEYRKNGGTLSLQAWRDSGKPSGDVALTAKGKRGFGETVRGLPIEEQQWLMGEEIAGKQKVEKEEEEKKIAAKKSEAERLADIDWERAFKEKEFGLREKQFEADEARRQREMLGEITPYQQQYLDLQKAQREQSRLENESLMGWYREQAQMQQQEQERQYTSQLMANPMSWLQYSAYTGQTPVVQEWMKPLMSQQYQTGQQIPGWMGGQGEGQAMGSLPELRTPSAQLWGRMGPTAQQQYMGYGQARTGIRPEETMFRLSATAPPSGRYGGLKRWR